MSRNGLQELRELWFASNSLKLAQTNYWTHVLSRVYIPTLGICGDVQNQK